MTSIAMGCSGLVGALASPPLAALALLLVLALAMLLLVVLVYRLRGRQQIDP